MPARDGAAQTGEVAPGLIGAGSVPAERLAVVDPVSVVVMSKCILMRRLVGV